MELQETWEKYKKTGNYIYRNEIIEKYIPLVKYVAGRMAITLSSLVDFNDLLGSGCIGLMDAIEKFDLAVGVKFETYAIPRIRGAILDELRSLDWTPRSVRKKARDLERATHQLNIELGRDATEEEIAGKLAISIQDLHKIFYEISSSILYSLEDLRATDEDGNALRYMDTIVDDKQLTPLSRIVQKDLKQVIRKTIEELPEKEKLVVALYYYENLTLKEIGAVLGVTESRVSQIHSKIIVRLRSRLRQKLGLVEDLPHK